MERCYIFKDGIHQASTATRESALELIREYQKQETHPILRAEFSIITGEEEFIPYLPQRKPPKRTCGMER